MVDFVGICWLDGKCDWWMGLVFFNDGGFCVNICILNDGVIYDEFSKLMCWWKWES